MFDTHLQELIGQGNYLDDRYQEVLNALSDICSCPARKLIYGITKYN